MTKTSSDTTTREHKHDHIQRHLSHKFKHLVKADGRRVYIASNPVEADELRRALSDHDLDAEFVIQGSDEHVSTLRHVHSFHQEQRRVLQKRHGEHFTELEAAIRDMDTVREELHGLEERVIELDAAAEKYGYDSHVRLREHPSHTKRPRAGQPQDFEKERRNAQSMAFTRKPELRQYYHKGLLWRANVIHEAGSYELFMDLVFVGIIAIAGDSATADATGHSLLRFVITVLMSWKFWKETSMYTAWFVQEDILRRISVLFVLFCLLGFTVNMEGFFGDTYNALAAFYITAVLMSAISLVWYASNLPLIKAVLLSNSVILLISVPLWIGSIHDHTSGRYILIWLGLFLDVLGFELNWALIFIGQKSKNTQINDRFNKWFEYIPGISVEHMVSRYDAFVTLVLGYSVVSLLYQSAASNPMNNFFCKAVLGLLQAFALNSLYFEMDSFNLYTHAVRRHNRLFVLTWKTIHIPLVMALMAAGATIARLVLAHDCKNCPVEALAQPYAARSQETISQGQRWFYAGGLGSSLICTSIIAGTHAYKRADGLWFFRHRKQFRLGLRTLVGVVIILLPLAGDRLNSLYLIATTAGLVYFVLFMELLGNVLDEKFCSTHKRDAEKPVEHVVMQP